MPASLEDKIDELMTGFSKQIKFMIKNVPIDEQGDMIKVIISVLNETGIREGIPLTKYIFSIIERDFPHLKSVIEGYMVLA